MSDTPEPSTVFVCSGGYHFSEWELEMGCTTAYMEHMTRENDKQHNFESDMSMERDPGLDFLDDDAHEQWPWYADEQWEVQEPEIIQT